MTFTLNKKQTLKCAGPGSHVTIDFLTPCLCGDTNIASVHTQNCDFSGLISVSSETFATAFGF